MLVIMGAYIRDFTVYLQSSIGNNKEEAVPGVTQKDLQLGNMNNKKSVEF